MRVKLLTEHHLEFLSLKGGCTDSSDSALVKMPHFWKSHVVARIMSTVIYFSPIKNPKDFQRNESRERQSDLLFVFFFKITDDYLLGTRYSNFESIGLRSPFIP